MANGKVTINEAIVTAIIAKVDRKLEDLGNRMVVTAKQESPVSRGRAKGEGRQRRRGGREYEFKVFVEIGDDGRPQIVKGGRTNAAASRAIKTKDISELTPVKGNAGLYSYTFKRAHGTLRKSIHLVKVGPGKIRIVANTRYAKFVHEGTTKTPRNPFLTRTLDHHMGEFKSGDFLKR